MKMTDAVGHEQAAGRPVVIISSNKGVDTSEVLTVAYMTTKYKQININVEVFHNNRRSWVLCNQIVSVDKSRFGNRMCKLSAQDMEHVDEALKMALGLEPEEIEQSPVEEEENDALKLQVELDTYKRLYEKALSKIVELQFGKDVVVKEAPVKKVEVATPTPVKVEPIKVDTETLKQKMNSVGTKTDGVKRRANVNTDTWETICEITGISDQTAKMIVKYRAKVGEYYELDDLLYVPRFGKGCLKKYRDLLEV